ncbi:hypothetical protein C8Q80DRAFT_1206005, partial [Daedaleopsis nitida]
MAFLRWSRAGPFLWLLGVWLDVLSKWSFSPQSSTFGKCTVLYRVTRRYSRRAHRSNRAVRVVRLCCFYDVTPLVHL